MIRAERELLLNLLGNLTDNARKASNVGDTIQISIRREAGEAMIEIEDEGEGIPEGEQDKVFETFYMADKVRSRRNDGVGLGLSICQLIIEHIGGKIWIDSDYTGGSRFFFTHPIRQSQSTNPQKENNA